MLAFICYRLHQKKCYTTGLASALVKILLLVLLGKIEINLSVNASFFFFFFFFDALIAKFGISRIHRSYHAE